MRFLPAYPFVALALTACGPSASVGTTAASGSLKDRWEARVATQTIAERIADNCYGEGIYLASSPYGGAVNRVTEQMVAEGEDRAALDALFMTHDFDRTMAAVDAWMARTGASPAQPATLCAAARQEMAEGSPVGQALRTM
ncbi:hypothetical protein GCM10011415_05020 [Salipiger pallidus]|uniref:Lipoprotein n=1 Tax=Salipiger pallidus TaxID=1775170 RepID=A0A8J2ZGM5_9RHOB|nr:hypothetical protein GCM10011415_05020 [Salipiger pallidus]